MPNASYAAKAVAQGPLTVAPPSFDGHGWLVVLNLTVMTAASMIAAMTLIYIAQMAWKDRRGFPSWTPLRVYRLIGSLFAVGIMLRSGVEAANIWGWNPLHPEETARFLFAKRLVDPVAAACGVSGLAMFVLSLPGMIQQLAKEPLPLGMWQSKIALRNMAGLTVCALIAAVGVVSTR